jgi:hypothetical protein
MAKIIKLTESDLTRVVKRVINEQMYHREHVYRIQAFLNKRMNAGLVVDGRTGRNSKTEEAIAKYQDMIGVYPTDGTWGEKTYAKMPEKDKIMLKNINANEYGVHEDLWGNFLDWVKKQF